MSRFEEWPTVVRFLNALCDADLDDETFDEAWSALGTIVRLIGRPSPPVKHSDQVDAHTEAVRLGHLGGLKGGPARAESLTPNRRSQIAAKAARTRWSNKSGQEVCGLCETRFSTYALLQAHSEGVHQRVLHATAERLL